MTNCAADYQVLYYSSKFLYQTSNMKQKLLKLLHFADIQYNVRNKYFSRKIEYEHVNKQLIEKSKNVDIVLIAGDVFEHYDTNNVEEQLFIDLIDGMLSANKQLVIYCICGNHDQKQRNVDFDNGSGKRENYLGTLAKLAKAINNERFVYFDKSAIYDTAFEHLKIAAWDTNAKYVGEDWSPWTHMTQQQIDDITNNNFVIEMFHDCVWNAVNFDGEVVKGDNESRVRPSEFHGHYVALGDIHMPSIVKLDNNRVMSYTRVMSYPSSTVARDFGEGDYHVNGKLTQQGNSKHGVNLVCINLETKDTMVQWMPLEQLVHLHTLKFDNDFDIANANVPTQFGRINKIKVINNVSMTGLSADVDAYVEKVIQSMPVANIDFVYGMQAIGELSNLNSEDDESLIADVQKPEKLKAIANEWCVKTVASNPQIADEDKQQIVDKFNAMFGHAIDACTFNVESSKWLLQSIKFNQFMALGETCIDFEHDSNRLIRLSGNNGNGKTTLFRAFKWLVTGLTDTWQNAGATKQNSIALFNDKMPDVDVIDAELKFVHLKGTQVTTWLLHRKLERFWKRNADKSNMSNITKVVESLQLENVETGQIIDNTVEINDKLYEVFGSIWELSRFVCIDQYQLDSIVMMKSEDFNDWLLDQLGINVFAQLAKQSDNIKQIIFDGLAKPAKNMETLNAELIETQTQLQTANQEHAKELDNVKQLQQELGETRAKVEETSKQLKHIPEHRTAQSIELDIAKTKTNIESMTQQLTLLLSEVPQELTVQLHDVKQQLANIEQQAQDAKQQHLAKTLQFEQAKLELQQSLQQLNNTIKERIAAMQTKMQQDKFELQQAMSEKSTSICNVLTTIAQQYNNATQQKIDECLAKREELNKASSTCAFNIKQFESNLSQLSAQLKLLESDSCPTCHRPMSGDASIDAIKQQLLQDIQTNKQNIEAESVKQVEADKQNKQNTDLFNELKSQLLQPTDYNSIVSHLTPQHLQSYQNAMSGLTELQKQFEVMEDNIAKFDATLSNHMTIVESQQIDDFNKQLQELSTCIATIVEEANSIYNAKLAQQTDLQTKQAQLQQHIEEAEKSVNLHKQTQTNIANSNMQLTKLESELANSIMYEQWAADNTTVSNTLQELKHIENAVNADLLAAMQTQSKLQTQINLFEADVNSLNAAIESIKTWNIADKVAELFKKSVSKKGLVQFVFEQIAASLNAELSTLLSNLHYRIFFDLNDDNTLKMIDLIGKKTIRPLRQMSGMQITFAGLSIVHLIISKRLNKIGNLLLIDEISGKLSDGNIVNAESDVNKIDYRNVLMKLLKTISKNRKVIVVDHILDYDEFDKCITVIMNDNGSASIV